jgi:SanA protein
LDYAGLRTLDSIVRCKRTFGHSKITIITQGFHNYRALFISDFYKMEAIGYSAKNAVWHEAFKTQWREYLARAKAIVDLYILDTKPRF